MGAPVVVVLGAGLLAACGPAAPVAAPLPAPTAGPDTTAEPPDEGRPLVITVDGEVVPVYAEGTPDYCATLDEPTGAAVERYGVDAVREGRCDVVTLLLEQGAESSFDRLDPEETTEEVVASGAFVKELLTPAVHGAWDDALRAVAAGDEGEALGTVALVALVGYDDGDFYGATRNGRAYSSATLDVTALWLSDGTGDGRLTMQVEQTTHLDLVDDRGRAATLPYERTVTFTLVPGPSPERPFLVDDWSGRVRLHGLRGADGERLEPTAAPSDGSGAAG